MKPRHFTCAECRAEVYDFSPSSASSPSSQISSTDHGDEGERVTDFPLTERQKGLARHALGLPNKRRVSYRNHYVGPQGDDLAAWNSMVSCGDARVAPGSGLTGGHLLFWLTRKGAKKALEGREKLDPEDFSRSSEGESA